MKGEKEGEKIEQEEPQAAALRKSWPGRDSQSKDCPQRNLVSGSSGTAIVPHCVQLLAGSFLERKWPQYECYRPGDIAVSWGCQPAILPTVLEGRIEWHTFTIKSKWQKQEEKKPRPDYLVVIEQEPAKEHCR